MLDTTTLADAPMIVRFPPRQAPKASDHHSESGAIPESTSCWTTGIAVAVYGMLSMMADAPAENHRMAKRGHVDIAVGRLGDAFRDPAHDPDLDDPLDHDEQADEEEDRRPLDMGQRHLRLVADEQHQDRGAQQRDRGHLDPQCAVGEEADDRQRGHDQGLDAAARCR